MKCVVINKIPFLKQCRNFFRLEYGIIDYDALLDCLCFGVTGSPRDQVHVRDMVYGDVWLQGHRDITDSLPFDEHKKTKLLRFLLRLRSDIIAALRHHDSNLIRRCRYLPNLTTSMSLKFEICNSRTVRTSTFP